MGKKVGLPKTIRGQLTVFACLIYGLIISLLVVMLESVFCQSSITQANEVTNLSVQSLFSQYSRPLLDEFEIFGGVYYEDDKLLSSLYSDIQKGCTNNQGGLFIKTFNPYGLKLTDINIQEKKMLTDDNGKYFYKEIVEFMKLGQFSMDNAEYIEQLFEVEDKADLEELDKEIEKRQNEARDIDEKILNLVNYVEGIKTTSTGFLSILGHKSCSGSFVKKLAVNGEGMDAVGISSSEVYKVTSGHYYDLIGKLEGLKGDLDWIKAVYFNPLTYGVFMDGGFRSSASNIVSQIDNSAEKLNKALEEIAEIEEDIKKLMENLETSKSVVRSKSEVKPELIDAYIQELEELKGYEDGSMYPICNLEEIKADLQNKKSLLQEMQSAASSLANAGFDIYSIDNMYGEVDSCIDICKEYDISTLRFDYSGINTGQGKKLPFLNKVANFFKTGNFKKVMGEDAQISNKKVNLSYLSSKKLSYSKISRNLLDIQTLYEDYLYNRYVKLWFSSYINPSENGLLQYEMEYILGNSNNDKKNLETVINELIALRFTAAMSHLICNPARKKECFNMATLLLGFSGVYGVIKLGQYALMTAWAYAEAVNDVKILVRGGKVPFGKTDENWKTNLNDIVEQQVMDGSGNDTGLEYEEYLELLLFLRDAKTKILRTMDAMEIRMSGKGYEHIRMYNYLYSIKGYATYAYRGKYEYSQVFSFSYQ